MPLPAAPFAVLDFPDASGARRPLLFRDPARVLVATRLDEVRAVLDAAEAGGRRGRHAVGFVSYEAAPAFDAALPVRAADPALPLAWMALFDAPVDAPALDWDESAEPIDLTGWAPDVPRDEYDDAVAAVRDGIARGDWYQV